jgi:hypothetical protein
MFGREDQRRRLQERLRQLEQERAAIEAELAGLPADGVREVSSPASTPPPVRQDQALDNRAKIDLFRSLFRGRSDVFPLRWENLKTGKSGYAPACANEWKRGLCEKPRVKCSACPNQAFIAATGQVVAHHLRGQGPGGAAFVAGVYPVLSDDSCWFLAADFDEAEWRRDVKAHPRPAAPGMCLWPSSDRVRATAPTHGSFSTSRRQRRWRGAWDRP